MQTIRVLQAGRALAALAVVAHHAAASAETFAGQLPAWALFLPSYGYLGVDFFFVLSGFIIHYINQDFDPEHYTTSRLRRVFAPYLPIGIAMALLYTFAPQVSAGLRDWSWLASLTLLPVGKTALIVAWTLQFELAFYVAYGLGRSVNRPILAIVALIVLGFVTGNGTICVEFLFGVLACKAYKRGYHVWPLFLPTLVLFIAYPQAREIFALSLAFLIVGLVQAERKGWLRISSVLVFLGNASYSIYLVHNPVCALMARFFDHWAVAFTGAFLVSLAAGIVYHLAVERPLLRSVRLRLPRMFSATPAAQP